MQPTWRTSLTASKWRTRGRCSSSCCRRRNGSGGSIDQLLDLSRLESGEVPFRWRSSRSRRSSPSVISEISMGRSISDVQESSRCPGSPRRRRPTPSGSAGAASISWTTRCASRRPGARSRVNARPDGERVQVSVTDTGVGIQPSTSSRLRTLLSRRSRSVTGRRRDRIGLAIARSIVEAHGGRIVAKSDPGHGSAFTFDLPAVEAAVAADDRRVR